MKKNFITVIRVLSMFSIIIGHMLSYSTIGYIKSLGQFCYIGVMLFFFISGFLYGSKKIEKGYLLNMIKKIILPELLFSIIILFIYYFQGFINGSTLIKYVIIYSVNLQYFFDYIFGIGHLWFISIIMICYFLTIILNKMYIKNIKLILLILSIISIILLFINQKTSQLLIYNWVYIFGYLYARLNTEFVFSKNKSIIYSTFIIISIILRMAFRNILDGTIIYNVGIVSVSNFICAFALFNILKNQIDNSAKLPKLISYFEKNSYYIYIVHYIFIAGPLSLMTITSSYLLNCIIVVIVSLLLSYIFMILFEKIIYLLSNREEKYAK